MSAEDEVRKASQQFYAALNKMGNGDASSLQDVWSHRADVTSMHPIGGREVGWDAVRTSFGQVAAQARDARIELKDQLVRTDGDVAWELGVERGTFVLGGQSLTLEHRVTNVYRQEAGEWKIVHHHTDPSPAMIDVLRKLGK
jgi:ketosteroid isomerase-like protein